MAAFLAGLLKAERNSPHRRCYGNAKPKTIFWLAIASLASQDGCWRVGKHFHTLCELIPKVFPNVRHLYIALQANIAPPRIIAATIEDRLSLVDSHILGPLEDMFRQIGPGPGKEFTVSIQAAGWYMFLEREAKLETHSHGRYLPQHYLSSKDF
ncbi:hypothetical protein NEMBOFW57_004251 [Staphylotrichum longicolle]|uniref:Uncharacterized protein n=1 Tax=Staphylotrichum longicolle TaxID=669026 RepID=A0AAD4I3Z7_9PEZI|nr:hypothetical protein NEMBOFW57_004251 [Staphylotrichum longicolle]